MLLPDLARVCGLQRAEGALGVEDELPRLAAAKIKCNEIFLPADTAMTPPSSNKKKRRLRETIVEFRSRFVVKDASTEDVFISGPWSAISAPLRWI